MLCEGMYQHNFRSYVVGGSIFEEQFVRNYSLPFSNSSLASLVSGNTPWCGTGGSMETVGDVASTSWGIAMEI